MTKFAPRLFNCTLLYYKPFKQFWNLFIAVHKIGEKFNLGSAVVILEKATESSPLSQFVFTEIMCWIFGFSASAIWSDLIIIK